MAFIVMVQVRRLPHRRGRPPSMVRFVARRDRRTSDACDQPGIRQKLAAMVRLCASDQRSREQKDSSCITFESASQHCRHRSVSGDIRPLFPPHHPNSNADCRSGIARKCHFPVPIIAFSCSCECGPQRFDIASIERKRRPRSPPLQERLA